MRANMVFLAAMASLIIAESTIDDPIEVDVAMEGLNNTIEARADTEPGFWQCKQRDFKKPCTWTAATGGNGALDCRKMIYADGATDPDTSFQPTKGVQCKLYGGSNCETTTPMLFLESPGANLLDLGRKAKAFPDGTVEGFFSFRCRSWMQKTPKGQEEFIVLPAKPS